MLHPPLTEKSEGVTKWAHNEIFANGNFRFVALNTFFSIIEPNERKFNKLWRLFCNL